MAPPNRAQARRSQRSAPPAYDSEDVRRRLNEVRQRLAEGLEYLDETTAEDYADVPSQSDRWEHSGYGDHLGDDATEVYERERALGQQVNVREHLRFVDRALHKLDAGTYGLCDVCGRPINPERLQAMPEAALCIDCKKKQESRAHLTGASYRV